MAQPPLPLARFKVLDLTRVRSGPTCVKVFADWGADVIKIEMPQAPGASDDGYTGDRDAADFQNLHRNKRSMTLNLKEDDGREIFYQSEDGRRMMAVEIETGPELRISDPGLLFEGPFQRSTDIGLAYGVSPDGRRFLMIQVSEDLKTARELVVVLRGLSPGIAHAPEHLQRHGVLALGAIHGGDHHGALAFDNQIRHGRKPYGCPSEFRQFTPSRPQAGR